MCEGPGTFKHSCRQGRLARASIFKGNVLLIWTFRGMIGLAGIGTSLPFSFTSVMAPGFLLRSIMFVSKNLGLLHHVEDKNRQFVPYNSSPTKTNHRNRGIVDCWWLVVGGRPTLSLSVTRDKWPKPELSLLSK